MGSLGDFEELSFEEQIKTLADEELLEMWAESQGAELEPRDRFPDAESPALSCEELIVAELSARAGRRLARG